MDKLQHKNKFLIAFLLFISLAELWATVALQSTSDSNMGVVWWVKVISFVIMPAMSAFLIYIADTTLNKKIYKQLTFSLAAVLIFMHIGYIFING